MHLFIIYLVFTLYYTICLLHEGPSIMIRGVKGRGGADYLQIA